jgi:hypothetical protein
MSFLTSSNQGLNTIAERFKDTPAMAAGVTDRLWGISDIVKVLVDWRMQTRNTH